MSVFGLDPRVERHLIADEGEVIVDEVRKHWAAIVGPVLEVVAAIPVLLLILWVPSQAYWVPLLLAVVLVIHGLWRILERRMDRFVITNMRVFRVHGILSQNIATMPIARILDISVHKPIIGRIFGYGHFIFESAAQDQGLREIKYVGSPNERGITIQRVIQRSGLRGPSRPPSRADYNELAESIRREQTETVDDGRRDQIETADVSRRDQTDTADVSQRDQTETAEMPWWRQSG